MTEQIGMASEQQDPSSWQKLVAWLSRIDEATNYDPAVHAVDMVRYLGQKVTRLESRLIELEQHQQENFR